MYRGEECINGWNKWRLNIPQYLEKIYVINSAVKFEENARKCSHMKGFSLQQLSENINLYIVQKLFTKFLRINKIVNSKCQITFKDLFI
jgi:hypothetical protein